MKRIFWWECPTLTTEIPEIIEDLRELVLEQILPDPTPDPDDGDWDQYCF